jgi:hypothetical protein
VRQLAAHASQLDKQLSFVDAPVSGGVNGAEAGTLTFMVGGDDAALAAVDETEVLTLMGQNIVRCGGSGTGQVGLQSRSFGSVNHYMFCLCYQTLTHYSFRSLFPYLSLPGGQARQQPGSRHLHGWRQ